MKRAYCSYFDHRYLPRGLAMIRSLRQVSPDAEVWVLCLSSEAYAALVTIAEPGVHLLTLTQVEMGDEGLLRARNDGRSLVEYYFTLTPSLVRFVMAQFGADIVTYLDGDLCFFSDVDPIYDALGSGSVLIIPHGFVPAMRHLEKFGIYNVGWLSFRNDAYGRDCLEWWRARSNEWCSETLDEVNGRYCEQRYLDYFSDRFPGVVVLDHPGANLAPWNVAGRRLSLAQGALRVDGRPLIFFHFHGIKRLSPTRFLTIHGAYRAPVTRLMREQLYRPYLAKLMRIEVETLSLLPANSIALRQAVAPSGKGLLARLRLRLRLLRAYLAGETIVMP